MQTLRTKGKSKTLAPVRPNVGVQVAYQRRLDRLVDQMNSSVLWWLGAAYGDALAMDATPAEMLAKVMRKLGRRWIRAFDDAADKIALAFATESQRSADVSMRKILKDAGFLVEFKQTREMRNALSEVVVGNVSLIRSIPSEHFTEIEGAVLRSVTAGRDLKALKDELIALGAKTSKRAAFIARDQNNKATSAMNKARCLSLGLTDAKWLHSKGGVHPRPSHVAASGELYNIAQGCYIDDEYIMPGEKPNCRCLSQTVIPGFED